MTLEQVAKRAGVSTATVSRVLNNATTVRTATRKRVLEAVRELRYYPNIHAQALAGAKSRSLGMIVSNLKNPYFLDIFGSLEAIADRHGYEVVVESTGYSPERLVASVHSMLGRSLLGLSVIVSEMDDSLIEDLTERDLPVVFHDVGRAMPNANHITVDWEKPMQKTVEYLYSLGHRRMAFIGHHESLASLQARRSAFLSTIEQYSRSVLFATEADIDAPEGGRRATRRLLSSGFKPTAILCVNDFMALGVLRELHDRKIAVPRQVSVTGFDNINLSEFTHPPLTTVNVPREQIGRHVFEALVPQEGRPLLMREIVVHPELVIRDSTAVAPG
jgi:LacI family transcriptional regulator, galactose operon repressor